MGFLIESHSAPEPCFPKLRFANVVLLLLISSVKERVDGVNQSMIRGSPAVQKKHPAQRRRFANCDYAHILDLAAGHLAAMEYLQTHRPGVRVWNLGIGRGSTVFDMVEAFRPAVERDPPYKVVGRRAGDVLNS
jgi:nucleoside-diphosphate-sugar epimerase